jgi:hypothetical protein
MYVNGVDVGTVSIQQPQNVEWLKQNNPSLAFNYLADPQVAVLTAPLSTGFINNLVNTGAIPGIGGIGGVLQGAGNIGSAISGICTVFPSLCGNGGNAGTLVPTGTIPTIGVQSMTACPPGYRLVGRAGAAHCSRTRHMNPLNAKALTRAARRIGMFQGVVKRIDKLVTKQLSKRGAHAIGRAPRRFGKCGTCKKSSCGGC